MTNKQIVDKLDKISNSLTGKQSQQIADEATNNLNIDLLDGVCEDLNPDNEDDYGEHFDDGDTDADAGDFIGDFDYYADNHKHPSITVKIVIKIGRLAIKAIDNNDYDDLLTADGILGGAGG